MHGWRALMVLSAIMPLASCSSPTLSDARRNGVPPRHIVATYSIAAFDPATGDLGVAVQSKYFGVGTVVPWAKAGVGAIATQALANIRYGPEGLSLLAEGKSPEQALKILTEKDGDRDSRQCGIVDAQGRSASYTGKECMAFAGHRTGKHYAIQGNILAGQKVIDSMAAAYEAAQKVEGSELADWLVAAIQAGEDAGGDRRGRQSAALLVVRDQGGYDGASDRYIDLRIEDHKDPTHELARLLEIHKHFYSDAHAARPVRKAGF
jgi:uncharacterized Ntn-hydrolase superfamily protein